MMKRITITALFSLAFLFSAFAQGQKLINNPDIVWLAETEMEYQFQDDNCADFAAILDRPKDRKKSEVRMIKRDIYANLGSNYLIHKIAAAIDEGKLKAYDLKDNHLLQPSDFLRMQAVVDTVITFNPETFEEIIQVVRSDNFPNIRSFVAKQYWFINKKNNRLQCVLDGIIPVLHIVDGEKKRLCYIPMNQAASHKLFDLNQEQISFAVETVDLWSWEDFKVLKGEGYLPVKKLLWDEVLAQKRDMYHPSNGIYETRKAMPIEELRLITEGVIDTVITFNPETFEETIQIIKNRPLFFEDFRVFQSFQFWAYDHKKDRLACYLWGGSLSIPVKDQNGNFRFFKPIYYLLL